MSARVQVGIAGCGGIARLVHIPLLSRRRDVDVRAVTDSDPAALAAAQSAVSQASGYATLERMLADRRLDAVVVALPTQLHETASQLVLEAACDLYLEKPLASTLDGGAAVLECWSRTDRIGMMGYNARFNPLIVRLRNLVRAGRGGRPVYVRCNFATAARDMPEWKRRRTSGGGALLDLGTHHLDALRFIFEREPIAVRATVESRCSEDDTCLLELEMEGELRVHGFFSLAASEREEIEIHGDRARLSVSRFTSLDVSVVDNPRAGGLLRRLRDGADSLRRIPLALRARRSPLREPGYAIGLNGFIEAVRTRHLPPDAATLADGYRCLAMIDAAERSARSGRWESIAGATIDVPEPAIAPRAPAHDEHA